MRAITATMAFILALTPAQPSGAAHYCKADTGTFVALPLPVNAIDPARTHLYIHDRSATPGTGLLADDGEGTWVYLENGKIPNQYNPGGIAVLGPLNTNSYGDPHCGGVLSPDGLTATPKAGADDVVL